GRDDNGEKLEPRTSTCDALAARRMFPVRPSRTGQPNRLPGEESWLTMSESGRCCRKSRKLNSSQNLAKVGFQLPPLLQASPGRIRSSVVAFLRFDVPPHIGGRGMHRRC